MISSFRMSRSGFSAHPLAKNPTIRAVIKRQLTNHAEIKGFSFSFLPFPFSPHALTSFSWKTWMISGFLASCRAKVPAPSGPSRSPAPSRIRVAAACCPAHAACRAVGGKKRCQGGTERPPNSVWRRAGREMTSCVCSSLVLRA